MKTTLKIAKLELSILFYSPIAWFLSVVFVFQCGLFYTSIIETHLTNQEIGGGMLSSLNYLTSGIFGMQRGLYGDVLKKVYLYLPLLTMGVISREISSGTIKLLYSSPVKISQIIFGKFMALMTYNLILIFILLIFVFTGILNIKQIDIGLVFAGLIAVYLLLCTYAAIGLFMSCLSSYQIVAAISTLVVFAILAYVGTIWQSSAFFREISYFLSINGRAEKIIYGLINTKDVAYFIIIIALFLGFSMIKLQSARTPKSEILFTVGQYAGLTLIAFLLGYVSSLPSFIAYYDPTVNETQTLTPTTQKVLKELGDAPLEVTSYINLVDQRFGMGNPASRNYDRERWEPYLRFKPNISFKYIYYYDEPSEDQTLHKFYPGKTLKEIAQQSAKSWKLDFNDFKSPAEIKKIINLAPEQNRYVMQLKYKNRTTFLRLFDDQIQFPTETETSAALKRLTVKLPKILFVTGQFERSKDKLGDRDYGFFVSMITNRNAMVNQGFDTDTVNLARQDIPDDITLLVIADPKISFKGEALAKIHKYIEKGGNLFVAGEPGKQAVVNPIIKPLGVSLMEGMLVQKSDDAAPEFLKAKLTRYSASLSTSLNIDLKENIQVRMPGSSGLHYEKNTAFTIKPLLISDEKTSWLTKKQIISDSTTLKFSAANGDVSGIFPVALSLQRNANGKEQRIIVSGDADFLSSAEVKGWGSANRDIYMPLTGWFTNGQFPIDTSRPFSEDNRLKLTDHGLTVLKIIYLGLFPGVIVLIGTVLLIRRKRK